MVAGIDTAAVAGAVPGGSSGNTTRCGRFLDAIYRKLNTMSYLCPGLFPWVDLGPATELSGLYVIKAVGAMYLLIIMFDLFAAYGSPGSSTFTSVMMILLLLTILLILLLISRRPQNRVGLMYATPGLPFVPTIAIIVNIYLILNLSVLTLVRFTLWMMLGLVMYFMYGIKNSLLEVGSDAPRPETPPPPNPLERAIIPPSPANQNRPTGDRNIFEGDGNKGLYGTNYEFPDPLLAWHEAELKPVSSASSSSSSNKKQVESRYNAKTNSTSSHTTQSGNRPPWAYPDSTYDAWDD